MARHTLPGNRIWAYSCSLIATQGIVDVTVQSAAELKDLVLAAVEDRKGIDPVVLQVSSLTEVTDYMMMVSGTSSRHVKAIVDNVLEMAKEHDVRVLGVEGRDRNDWVLVDIADVVLHVMRPQTRSFYDLERLWEVLESTPAETPTASV